MSYNLGKLLENNKVELEWSGDGYIYKNIDAFDNKEGICYIGEYDIDDEDSIVNSYTYYDLLNLAKHFIKDSEGEIDEKEFPPETICRDLFEWLNWQSPETLILGWKIRGVYEKV